MTLLDADALEPRLRSFLATARGELVLIAPFIKEPVMRRLLDEVDPSVDVRVVTRWRVDEIAAGVSDLAVWPLILGRGGALGLLDNLHAKVFIADRSAIVGSANLTGAALSGPRAGNLELLVQVPRVHPAVAQVEEFIEQHAVPATEDLYRLLQSAVVNIPIQPANSDLLWFPRSRHPRDILAAAIGEATFTTEQVNLARRDLAGLGLPPDGSGVDERLIAGVLHLQPVVNALSAFIDNDGGRRFGELRDWLPGLVNDPAADPQTLVRWVLEFLPEHFVYSRPRYSEILSKGPA